MKITKINNSICNSLKKSLTFHSNINVENQNYPLHKMDNYIGCIIGGAIGDALGAPVEGKSFQTIQKKFGINGITDFQRKKELKIGTITDDTHMTFYTIDGLIKNAIKNPKLDKIPDTKIMLDSYKDWLNAQKFKSITQGIKFHHGWISDIENLNHRRTPGKSCLTGIGNKTMGTLNNKVNDSKGNGAIMRMAPVGLMYYKNPKLAFDAGVNIGCLSHGNAEGYLPSGCLAAIIANLIQGNSLEKSIDNTIEILKTYDKHEKTLNYINKAKEMVKNNTSQTELTKILGKGQFGSDSLACALYCSLKNPTDFKKAVLTAINHTKDNDSVGAITGNIMGAALGSSNIPKQWIEKVEFSQELQQAGIDLFTNTDNIKDKDKRYPVK